MPASPLPAKLEPPALTRRPVARFWDRIARRYAASPVKDPAAYQTKLSLIKELLSTVPDAQVVEIACGTGSTALAVAPFAARLLAADVSAEMIAIASRKPCPAGAEGLTFEVAAVEEMEVAPASQDMVMAHSVLHLLRDRHQAIAIAFRWLKPGGYFVSSTVCMAETAPWLRHLAPVLGRIGLFPPTLSFFGEADLLHSIEAAGFVLERRFRPSPKAAVFLIARKPG